MRTQAFIDGMRWGLAILLQAVASWFDDARSCEHAAGDGDEEIRLPGTPVRPAPRVPTTVDLDDDDLLRALMA